MRSAQRGSRAAHHLHIKLVMTDEIELTHFLITFFGMCVGDGRPGTRWLALVSLLWLILHQSLAYQPPPILDRLSYGFVGSKPRPTCVIDGYVPYVLHFRLADRRTEVTDSPTSTTLASESAKIYQAVSPVYTALEDMADSFRVTVRQCQDRVAHLIPDVSVLRPDRRARRGWFDFVGSASSWLFGTATQSDIKELRALVQNSTRLFELSAADSKATREGQASFASLANHRFDLLNQGLARERDSVNAIACELQAERNNMAQLSILFTKALYRIAHFTTLHEALLVFEQGLEQLFRGNLSPLLLPPGQARDIMQAAAITAGRDRKLCVNTLRQFYDIKTFDYARINADLALRIQLPYTQSPGLYHYEITTTDFTLPTNLAAVSFFGT